MTDYEPSSCPRCGDTVGSAGMDQEQLSRLLAMHLAVTCPHRDATDMPSVIDDAVGDRDVEVITFVGGIDVVESGSTQDPGQPLEAIESSDPGDDNTPPQGWSTPDAYEATAEHDDYYTTAPPPAYESASAHVEAEDAGPAPQAAEPDGAPGDERPSGHASVPPPSAPGPSPHAGDSAPPADATSPAAESSPATKLPGGALGARRDQGPTNHEDFNPRAGTAGYGAAKDQSFGQQLRDSQKAAGSSAPAAPTSLPNPAAAASSLPTGPAASAAGSGMDGGVTKGAVDAAKTLADAKKSGATTGEAVEAAAQKAGTAALSAGLQAVSVPAPVAAKLAQSKAGQLLVRSGVKTTKRLIWFATAVVMVFTMLLLTLFTGAGIAIFGGGRSYLWDVSTANVDIPESYLDAYYQAGVDENIPWTLLAAAGAVGSYHGRVNPYLQPVPEPPMLAGAMGGIGGVSGVPLLPGQASFPTPTGVTSSVFMEEGNWTWNGDSDPAGEHNGLDFKAAMGTPVYSIQAGTVTTSGSVPNNSWCGTGVVVKDASGGELMYCHLSATRVAAGTRVNAGTQIAESGGAPGSPGAGRSFGPHLHVTYTVGGKYADPASLLVGAVTAKQATSSANVTSPTSVPKSVYLYGDSLSDGTEPYLPSMLKQKGVSKYYGVHKQSMTLLWGLEQLRNAPPPPDATIVMAFGTNTSGSASDFGRQIDQVFEIVGPTQQVYWVNLYKPRGDGGYNKELFDSQQEHRNLHVMDWETYAKSQGLDPLKSDPKYYVHYDSNGYKIRAQYIADYVTGSVPARSYTGVSLTGGGAVNAPVSVNLTGPGVLPDPQGRCPTLPSPIKGSSRTQGFGPLMLSPASLDSTGIDGIDSARNLQNICDSVEVLARVLRDTAETVATEKGMSYPSDFYALAEEAKKGDPAANETVAQFWIDVVNRADVFGGTDDKRCEVAVKSPDTPMRDWVSSGVIDGWTCELADARLRSVTDTYTELGGLRFVELPRLQARKRAVTEALQVAWLFSHWDITSCKPDADVAGVFPLTEALFEQYVPQRLADKTRCDGEANILAAARAFKAGEVIDPALRAGGKTARGWGTMYGGWSNFGAHVLGPASMRDEFLKRGRRDSVSVTAECSAVVSEFLRQSALDKANPLSTATARELQYYGRGATLGQLPAFESWFTTGPLPALQGAPSCQAGYSGAQWFTVLNTVNAEAGAGASSTPEATAALKPSPAVALDSVGTPGDVLIAMRTWISQKYTSATTTAARYPATPLISRISPVNLTADTPDPAPGKAVSDLGNRLVGIAIGSYGGLWPYGAATPFGSAGGLMTGQSAMAAAAVAWAVGRVEAGARYVASAGRDANPQGMAFDCSSFTYTAYKVAGLDWSMQLSYMQLRDAKHVIEVPLGQEQAGDLIFQDWKRDGLDLPRGYSGKQGIDHVGLVLDPKKKTIVHAANPTDGVKIGTYSLTDGRTVAFGRIIDPLATSFVTAGSYDPLVQQAIQYQDISMLGSDRYDSKNARDTWLRYLKRPLGPNQIAAINIMVREYKLPVSEWACLNRMWWYESGWNHLADENKSDPYDGYGYGIPQATPGSKMGAIAKDWPTNASTQVRWGLLYLTKYGNWREFKTGNTYPGPHDQTPCGVWGKWKWSIKYNGGYGNY